MGVSALLVAESVTMGSGKRLRLPSSGSRRVAMFSAISLGLRLLQAVVYCLRRSLWRTLSPRTVSVGAPPLGKLGSIVVKFPVSMRVRSPTYPRRSCASLPQGWKIRCSRVCGESSCRDSAVSDPTYLNDRVDESQLFTVISKLSISLTLSL